MQDRIEKQRKIIAEKREQADQLTELADRLRQAESIAADVPVLSTLFHEARTSRRKSREGRFFALYDYDAEDGWTERQVTFLQQGTHLREHGADLALSQSPQRFMDTKTFKQRQKEAIDRKVQALRQDIGQIEEHISRIEQDTA